ncbi:MAG: RING finger domain-containing protein [bacterium]
MPRCGHTFHDECLESWLQKRFRCPNCNTDIKPEDGPRPVRI